MLGRLLLPEIEELVRAKEFRTLKETLADLPPADLADLISDLEESDMIVSFRLLPKGLATEVFEYLDFPHQEALINSLKRETIRQVLEDMSPDDRTALLEELPAKAAGKLIGMLSPEERAIATTLLNYPEETVGRAMTPDFVWLTPDMTAEEAIRKIRQVGLERETVYSLYVVDSALKLLGVLTLRHLVVSPEEARVGDLMVTDIVKVYADADRETAAELLEHYDLLAVPVVDREDKLIGIVTFDDVLDIVEAEHTEDVQMQAAVLPTEESYLEMTVRHLVQRRVVWLVILLIAEVGGTLVLSTYDQLLQSMIALTFFLPMMTATGGNTGTQSAALVIRALATGEVELTDVARVLVREIGVGFALSALLGFCAASLALVVQGDPAIGLCVGIGLAVIVTISNLAGTLLPLAFEKLKMDPALMSGPFISTIVDIFGLVIYLEISKHVMHWMSA